MRRCHRGASYLRNRYVVCTQRSGMHLANRIIAVYRFGLHLLRHYPRWPARRGAFGQDALSVACASRVTPPVAARRGISMSYVAVQPRNQRVCTRSTKQQLEMCCCYCSVA